jgi:hypothetical protein
MRELRCVIAGVGFAVAFVIGINAPEADKSGGEGNPVFDADSDRINHWWLFSDWIRDSSCGSLL